MIKLSNAQALSDAPSLGEIEATEVVLGGRRYRLVLIEESQSTPSVPPAQAAELLTARELQIAALVAEGMVNKQIADRLQISEWTVSTHLRRVFAKLGVETRAAMVSRCLGGPLAQARLR